jgi:hypothetical protein
VQPGEAEVMVVEVMVVLAEVWVHAGAPFGIAAAMLVVSALWAGEIVTSGKQQSINRNGW